MKWFQHTAEKTPWVLVGGLTFGFFCILTLALTYLFSGRATTGPTSLSEVFPFEGSTAEIETTSPLQVRQGYVKALVDLEKTVDAAASDAAAFTAVEAIMLSVHVPKELLDAHLETVLAAKRLQARPDTTASKRSELTTLITYLLNQARRDS